MRVFVCSPLRGPDGQPSEENKQLARMLMRAVFDAGHHPFVPHLLYPQVLTESKEDLDRAFRANYVYLDVCDEIWVYARDLDGCSTGMKFEVDYSRSRSGALLHGVPFRGPRVEFMPPPFAQVEEAWKHRRAFHAHPSHVLASVGQCRQCKTTPLALNSQELCLPCFSGGTPF